MRLSVTSTTSMKYVQTPNMKLGAKLDRMYLPPNARASAGSNFLQTPHLSFNSGLAQKDYSNAQLNRNTYAQNAYSGFGARPERARAALERNAAILRQDNANDGEIYSYAYETENGIYAEEIGEATNGVRAQGGYSYTGDDGKLYSVRYTADENGFVPQGDHIPTSPPIPEAILRALEQNARGEASAVHDDGSYRQVKYSAAGSNQQYYNTNAQPTNYNKGLPVPNHGGLRKNFGFYSQSIEKNYLPPIVQRNQNQRNGNYNARDGYRY